MKHALIIGSGICGLASAYGFCKAGWKVTIIEKSYNPGGVIQSLSKDGYLIEQGPNSMLVDSPELEALLQELDTDKQLIRTQDIAKKRYLMRNDKLVAAPMGPLQFLRSPILSTPAKARLLLEPFIKRSADINNISLADFTRRRLGPQVLDFLINPMVSGIYAGDPEKLSIAHAFPKLAKLEQDYGSLIRGAIATRRKKKRQGIHFKPYSVSYKNGMHTLVQQLIQAMGDQLHIEYSTTIKHIGHKKNGSWTLCCETPKQAFDRQRFDALVIAIPAHQLRNLPLPKKIHKAVKPVTKVEYPPLTALFLGYPSKAIAHPLDGFGLLIPQTENKKALGVLFSSSLFPKRAPQDHSALTVFVGGERHPKLAQQSTTQLLPSIQNELQQLLGISTKPDFIHQQLLETIHSTIQYRSRHPHRPTR